MSHLPTSIEQYTLHRRLGHGGNADVFEATHKSFPGIPVALKRVRLTNASDPAGEQRRFAREAELLRSLSHVDIVRFIDSGDDFIVMELCPWPSLRTRIESGRIPYAEVLRIASRLSRALDYLHKRHVCHRDIKPENILTQGEQIKLVDFGISFRGSLPATQQQAFVGTPMYAPPEAFGEPEQDVNGERYDLYALGVVIHEALTGRNIFRPPDSRFWYSHILNLKQRVDRLELGQEFPSDLRDLVSTLTARRPGNPGPTAVDVTKILETLTMNSARPVADTPLATIAVPDVAERAELGKGLPDAEGSPYRTVSPPPESHAGGGQSPRSPLPAPPPHRKGVRGHIVEISVGVLISFLGSLAFATYQGIGSPSVPLPSPGPSTPAALAVPPNVRATYPSCEAIASYYTDDYPPASTDSPETWEVYCIGMVQRFAAEEKLGMAASGL